MMSTPNREELLSAYLDGELSPEEQENVERALEESPGDRELQEELSEASLAVRTLHRPYAPAGFRAEVMDLIDQRQAAVSLRALGLPSRMSRTAGWSSLIAVGLLLLVGGWALLGRPDAVRERNMAQAIPSAAVHAPAMMGEIKGSARRAAVAMSQAPGEPHRVQVVGLSKDEIRRKISELDHQPMPGNAIKVPGSLRTENGETPIVVVFTVVDVMQAMNQMQVLVRKQQVRTLDNRVVELNQAQSRDSQLTAVTLELAMDGPEMAALLNSVPAIDAVMYVEDNQEQASLLAEGSGHRGAAGSNEAIATNLAADTATMQPRRDAADQSLAPAADQPTQFDFRQLAEPVGQGLAGRGTEVVPLPSAAQSHPKQNLAAAPSPTSEKDQHPAAKAESTPPSPAMAAAANRPLATESQPASASPSTDDWEQVRKFRAIVLLKQQQPAEHRAVAPEEK